jgi:diaminohydroxyphosphoribosylaminopyrimidine deaminase/5-amino-6-(5-phosphoribosylamino)uracil reductase
MARLASMTGARTDADWMTIALAQARRGLGRVWPNPTVGCVIVRDGKLLAAAHTRKGGRPHAETEALADARAAGHDLRGATAYVTLEPCSHHGRTPPCAEALIAAGIARVVCAAGDPDPRVNGRGLAMLRQAGIAVDEGVGAAAASEINAGFFLRVREGRPLVTLKLATSLDGHIALASGESRWITGAAARQRGHLLRATHDGILVGIGTALADDPDLTCRLPGMAERSPVRIVLDSGARLPMQSCLVRTAREVPVWLVAGPDAPAAAISGLEAAGVVVLRAPLGADGHIDAAAACRALGERGLTRVLVEGGAAVAGAFVARNLVDRLEVFRSGLVLGAGSRSAIGALGLASLAAAPRFARVDGDNLGDDRVETWVRRD